EHNAESESGCRSPTTPPPPSVVKPINEASCSSTKPELDNVDVVEEANDDQRLQ
ncbi:unnamed protein product, partial [Amoebophrya sp. A25]